MVFRAKSRNFAVSLNKSSEDETEKEQTAVAFGARRTAHRDGQNHHGVGKPRQTGADTQSGEDAGAD